MQANPLSREWDIIESLATGRQTSLFTPDFKSREDQVLSQLKGSRVAIIGAAGSIGSEVVRLVSQYPMKTLSLFDISENNLVEVVRDLRSNPSTYKDLDLQVLPLGVGEKEFAAFFKTQDYDHILNFSAMKHVRSEKDIFCLSRMLRTNVLALHELMQSVTQNCRRVFSVSSDKAVRPSNLMGASKNVMEQALLYGGHDALTVTSARFANVAFSEGSLPAGFIKRVEKKQPLAAPSDVRRYFISHKEAAELSLLGAITGDDGEVFLPKQEGQLPEVSFSEIAIRFLEHKGFTPVECCSDEEARNKTAELIPQKKWPCYFSPSNTTGEKALEEFVGDHDTKMKYPELKNMEVVKRTRSEKERSGYQKFIQVLSSSASLQMSKADMVGEISKVVPGLTHVELNNNLDSKM